MTGNRVSEQFVCSNMKGVCQCNKNSQTEFCVSCFNMAHVGNRDIYQFGKLFLREAADLSEITNTFSDFFVIQDTHRLYSKIILEL